MFRFLAQLDLFVFLAANDLLNSSSGQVLRIVNGTTRERLVKFTCEKTQTVIVEMEHVTLSQIVSDGYLCVFFHVRRKSHHNGIT